MTRRVGGIALLIVALLGTLIITRLDGVRVAGTAIAPPGVGAPSVGDCAVRFVGPAPTTPAQVRDPRAPGAPADEVSTILESGVRFGACTGEHVGEVVAYRTMPRQALTEVDRAADVQWCRSVAGDYQAHARWRVRDAASGVWIPLTGQQFTTVLSDVFPVSDEPRWSACMVGATGNEAYTGSYLQSFAVGMAPAPFGRCMTDGERARDVSCTAPHDAQEFGVGSGAPMSAREAVAACRELIAAMTGMADITAAGRLRTELVGGGTRSADPVGCRVSVVGPAQLTATLIGIGNGGLPLL
ncbi:hypothetical protein ACVBEQ_17990 [Nakamurella sp. GG22]